MGAVRNFDYDGKRASCVGSEILDGVWVTAVTSKELSEQNQTFAFLTPVIYKMFLLV